MTGKEFRERINTKRVILDGATGSNLQAAGMPAGICPEAWILAHQEILIDLQMQYLKAGTDILYAPTFSANRIKLAEYGLAAQAEQMNQELIALSKEAIKRAGKQGEALVAADLTMTGCQLSPIGTMDFEELIAIYKAQISYAVAAGADLIAVETMMSLQECMAALLAAKEICDLPVMVTLTFSEDGRTLYGTPPEVAAAVLEKMGADAVGINCSAGPDRMLPLVEKMLSVAGIPVVVKPNAGLPVFTGEKTEYSMGPAEFAEAMEKILSLGAAIVGGCCGTTPEHIRCLAEKAAAYAPADIRPKRLRMLSTERNLLPIELDGRFLVIGERINPTGKKALQAELFQGKMDMVGAMAEEQVANGADILDINVGLGGIDEKEMMLAAMEMAMNLTDVPLCFDSSHPEVIEAALRRYPGRALINSISLEEGKICHLLPIAKKYGAMFILLPLSDKGMPKDQDEKKEIIDAILARAKAFGLEREDVLVDGLVNTVGASREAAVHAIETIRYCKEELGVATMCGLSNISFGLPERPFVNAAFLAFAIQAGLTMAILNPSQDLLMNLAFASDLLRAKEDADIRYIERMAKRTAILEEASLKEQKEKAEAKKAEMYKIAGENFPNKQDGGNEQSGADREIKEEMIWQNELFQAVMKGRRGNIVALVQKELGIHSPEGMPSSKDMPFLKGIHSPEGMPSSKDMTFSKGIHSPEGILNHILIPAISKVGELFQQKKYFLPQLIASAEAMKIAVGCIEPLLKKDEMEKAGKVVIATVAGDIHDIGKNLVALMLRNYGFEVIDLGKDVPSEKIILTAKEQDADLIAISALMTTTMQEMKKIVKLRDDMGLRAKIMIGGAVVTQEYCDEIHADGYSKDAQEAVELAKRLR